MKKQVVLPVFSLVPNHTFIQKFLGFKLFLGKSTCTMEQTLNSKHLSENDFGQSGGVSYFCPLIQFYIPPSLSEVINTYKQKSKNIKESGGLVFGKITEGKMLAERISLPNVFDVQTRQTFETNRQISELLIEHERVNSAGVIQYIGEWHTHPENYPKLSNQDAFMMRAKHKQIKSKHSKVILLIQGILELSVWCYDGENIIKLQKL